MTAVDPCLFSICSLRIAEIDDCKNAYNIVEHFLDKATEITYFLGTKPLFTIPHHYEL